MIKIIYAVLFVLSFCLRGNAQNYIPYYSLVNEAEYAVYNQDYKKAVSVYEAAFDVEKPHPKDSYLLAYSLSELDSAANKDYIQKLLLQVSESSSQLSKYLREKPLNIYLDSDFLDQLSIRNESWKQDSQALDDTMAYFNRRHRELLTIFHDSISPFYEENEKESIEFRKRMVDHDSIFQREFLDYIQANGYPGFYTWGSDIAASFLQNLNPALYLNYEKTIFHELQKGRIQPFFYGLMVDEMECYLRRKSFYGTTDLLSACQPAMEELVNNRISIGLSPYFRGLRRSVSMEKYRLLEPE